MHKKDFKITGEQILVKDEMILFPAKKKGNSKKYRFDNDSIDNDDEENNKDLIDFSYKDENEDKEEFGGRTKYQSVWKNGNILNNGLRFI
jgi:hypothetical protein